MIFHPRLILILLIFLVYPSVPQDKGSVRILFYNTENLFDIQDDPITSDEEFLPGGARFWNYNRFQKKLNNIAKAIIAAGGWDSPGLIGLCEVENRFVVERLLSQTPLKRYKYAVIHKESPDERGIDISLIYSEEKFQPLKYKYIPVKDKNDSLVTTREILYVKGVVCQVDTIHLFFNHWPSRYGGFLETAGLRRQAAKALRSEADSLFQQDNHPKIVIMGDFNDLPGDKSIAEALKAVAFEETLAGNNLVNLSEAWESKNRGTIKYLSQWYIYDQVIVSRNIIGSIQGVSCLKNGAAIFYDDFLVEEDRVHGGIKPFRTYNGFQYNGGYSDHLPVYLDLFLR